MKPTHSDKWASLESSIPKDILKAEVSAWANHIEVSPKEIHIRPMKNKWGSCSSKGRLTFSSDLLNQDADFRKKVIIEELLHLRVPNHGKLFKALFNAYCDEGI